MSKFSYPHLRGQLQGFWSGLALREKRLLGGAGLVLASLLTWLRHGASSEIRADDHAVV